MITDALRQIYPTIDLNADVLVQDDGDGEYIAEWNYDQPQPTAEELDAAYAAWQASAVDRLKTGYKQQVDLVIDAWRQQFVSPGQMLIEEYKLKQDLIALWNATAEGDRPSTPALQLVYDELAAYQDNGKTTFNIYGVDLPVTTADEVVALWSFNSGFLQDFGLPKSAALRIAAKTEIEMYDAADEADMTTKGDTVLAGVQAALEALPGQFMAALG